MVNDMTENGRPDDSQPAPPAGAPQPAPPPIPQAQPIILQYMPKALVTLNRMPLYQAESLQAMLEAHGIPCFITDSHSVNPALQPIVRLQVNKADLFQAQRILIRFQNEEVNVPRCPECNSTSVEDVPLGGRARWFWRLGVLLVFVVVFSMVLRSAVARPRMWLNGASIHVICLGVVMVVACVHLVLTRKKRCKNCGHQW